MKLSQIIKVAYLEALKAYKKNEVPVAAVIFNDEKIISKAHNLSITRKDPLAHAEILALKKAARKLNTYKLNNYNIYITLEPCLFCNYAISKYLINSIYFGLYDNKEKTKRENRVFNEKFKGYKPYVYGGIGEEKFSKLMKGFFKKIRLKN